MHSKHKRVRPQPEPKRPSDAEIIEETLLRILERLKKSDFEPKVSDLLKVLELKYKLGLAGNAREKIVQLIEELRRDEMGKPQRRT